MEEVKHGEMTDFPDGVYVMFERKRRGKRDSEVWNLGNWKYISIN